jgi:hypothetical protein
LPRATGEGTGRGAAGKAIRDMSCDLLALVASLGVIGLMVHYVHDSRLFLYVYFTGILSAALATQILARHWQ